MTPTVLTLTAGLVWSPAGATAIADGPPSRSLWAEIPGFRVPAAVRYSEPKTMTSALSLSASSIRPSLVAGLTTTCFGMSGVPTEARAPLQQLLRLALLERLPEGVPDVGEGELGAVDGEQPTQRERVAVVVGVVVGNDDLQCHFRASSEWWI